MQYWLIFKLSFQQILFIPYKCVNVGAVLFNYLVAINDELSLIGNYSELNDIEIKLRSASGIENKHQTRISGFYLMFA